MSGAIDWGKAPEWAGAVVSSPSGKFYWVAQFGGISCRQLVGTLEMDATCADMTGGHLWELVCKRPTTWSGNGLPQPGTSCEYRGPNGWEVVEAFAVKPNHNGSLSVLFTRQDGTWLACAEPSYFRPIRTPEQIAAEEREDAILAIAEVIGHQVGVVTFLTPRETAEKLYDAGYRKQVTP